MYKLIISIILLNVFAFAANDNHKNHNDMESKGQETRQLEAHDHNKASLIIAFDKNQGRIEFKSSADPILGFEHEAKSDKEKKKLSEVMVKIESDISKMVKFVDTVSCKFTKDVIEMKSEGSSDHFDFIANFNVSCEKSPLTTSLKLDFSTFKKLKTVETTILVDTVQKFIDLKSKPESIELK